VAHRLWWGLPARGAVDAGTGAAIAPPTPADFVAAQHRSVTELIYVPDVAPGTAGVVTDGAYLLNLQMAAMCLDATPSRPILIPILT